ncbi:MAG: Swt1 family HEPN domain-containing protein [Acidobacteriota bacterium]
MAITNRERVNRSLDLLRQGLTPFIRRELENSYHQGAEAEARRFLNDDRQLAGRPLEDWDVSALLKLMWAAWNSVFRKTLGHAERSLVSELRDHRNSAAHQRPFSGDETYRALDSVGRLLTAVSAPEAAQVEKMKLEALRRRFDEQVRSEKRRSADAAIETGGSHLKAWRDVVTPHRDVASGRYQQAEFAADLWQVHLDEGTDEYRQPVEFFRRTFLTDSLHKMLVSAVRRLTGEGGDPVVQLQTNFGGGKTHSMLALYHLFSGASPSDLAGIDAILEEAEVEKLPPVRRVVLVGNKISPGNPSTKDDGTVVRTLWGELAWQLGGREAFERLRADDEKATSPGDVLRELFKDFGPCLVLIDEWVAYARQLHDEADLPAGSFETQFSFAQVLTESAKLAPNCLLVVSLPASDTASPHALADDVEVGGQRGREALDRLRNVIGRVEASWRPASAEEGFEIVRRRLFEPMTDPDQFKHRDVVARAFADLYRAQQAEFPPECREGDYENRIKAAYPIHPELFDRLYTDWSTLVKFQRTRGVLRLMASVIHTLWERGDRAPLILPAFVSIDDPRVRDELTRYLSDNWVPVIEKDVDGPGSLPLRIDGEVPNLGKLSACRRVARAIYLGSAPLTRAAHRGLEDRRVKLGCVLPGETPTVFGDALRRLSSAATYLYHDGARYWYSTQPTVKKLAEDRAEQLLRDPNGDRILQEIEDRVAADLKRKGDFTRIHPMPATGHDVPDDLDARLVVLRIDHPYSKEAGNAAELAAQEMLDKRGSAPRLFQNTLIFLAADRNRLQELREAAALYLAWQSILGEHEELNLDPQQVKQAETQKKAADATVPARVPETYQWLLYPHQSMPQDAVTWQAQKLSGHDVLAERASKKLVAGEMLILSYAGTSLRRELDKVPLWRGDHVAVGQLVEDFARYAYLPRLRDSAVLHAAVLDGLALLTWEQDTFAYADSYDETTGRYRGLRTVQGLPSREAVPSGLLVKPEIAKRQMETERSASSEATGSPSAETDTATGADEPATPTTTEAKMPTRFHGAVDMHPTRFGRDAGQIAEEVVAHLAGILGATVRVTLEIEAEIPEGAPDHLVRTVTENSRTLKFKSYGFEQE